MVLSNGDYLFGWPLAKPIVVTAGWYYDDGSAHNATDMRAATGAKVYAAEDGTVDTVQTWDGKTKSGMQSYGNMVRITHAPYNGGELKTRYAHLSKLLVSKGQTVKKGDCIGLAGNTGHSFGSHLHFEVILKNVRRNPLLYLDGDFTKKSITTRLWKNSTDHSVVVPVANNATTTPAPATPAKEPESASYCTYTVQPGDSFYKIAETMLGRGARYPEICALNGLDAKAVLQPGQKLKVPATGSYAAVVNVYALNVRSGASTGTNIVQVIKKGDAVTVYAEHNKMGYIGGGWCALQYLKKV